MMRKRISPLGPGRWALERERLQLPPTFPPPTVDPTCQVADLLPGILKDYKLDEKAWQQALADEWPQLVGPQVSQRTRPGAVQNRVLTVFVNSPVWLSELTRTSKPLMLKKIQDRFGADRIRELRLQADPGEYKAGPPARSVREHP